MRDYEEKSYYEIQLDNKQLILVFLAAVTVCVLIFVLGVMIGKGQKEAEFAATARDEKKLAAAEPDSNTPQQPLTDIASEARSEEKNPPPVVPVAEKPAPVREERKEQKQQKQQEQKPAAVETKQPEKYAYEDLDKTEETPEVIKEEDPAPAKVAPAVEEPQPSGKSRFTVQVMATSSKPKAQEQISRLKSHGYKPFMDESKTGEISVFKVRVGRFADTDEAKKMASKIKSDMKLETWVAELD